MNLEYTFYRYFCAERLLLPFSVEGQVSRSDERYLLSMYEKKEFSNARSRKVSMKLTRKKSKDGFQLN